MTGHSCEPENYDGCNLAVERTDPGRYKLRVYHHHEHSKTWCPNDELYDELSWEELLEVMLVVVDGRRPGMHPAGWEQTRLF